MEQIVHKEYYLHIHYRTGLVCRVSNTLGKGPFALGKGFAECGTRQTALGKKSDGEGTFAECQKALGKLFETRLEKQRLKIAKHFIFAR